MPINLNPYNQATNPYNQTGGINNQKMHLEQMERMRKAKMDQDHLRQQFHDFLSEDAAKRRKQADEIMKTFRTGKPNYTEKKPDPDDIWRAGDTLEYCGKDDGVFVTGEWVVLQMVTKREDGSFNLYFGDRGHIVHQDRICPFCRVQTATANPEGNLGVNFGDGMEAVKKAWKAWW